MTIGGALARLQAVSLALAALSLHPAPGWSQVPPDEEYRSFETEHFRVIFPERLETFSRRAARSAEWAYDALSRQFISPPSGRIALVITDNTDRPNASATPIPTNRITLIAAPQLVNRGLSYHTDWVDLTLVHELTHIFHLDRAGGIWSPLRTLFGRVPAFFPAFYQPRWVVEGLPTYYESRLTGAGRAYGSYFEMLLSADARQEDFLPVDAADGLVPEWPADQAPYLYGGLYFRALAEAHGDSALANFVRHGSARLPYTLDWAATPHFGQSLSAGWSAWQRRFEQATDARAHSLRASNLTAGEPVSEHTWILPGPRYSPDGRLFAMTFIEPRDEAATLIVDSGTGEVVRRVRRNASGGNAWSRDGATLYTQQAELTDRYRRSSDLYALDVASGKERRLTAGGRLGSPDMAPDGETLVAVQVGAGTNRLVSYDLASGELSAITQYVDTVNWGHPRWSPDGRSIAAERWVRGRILDVVIIDRRGRIVQRVTEDRALDVAPSWSPDGRYLLWASDRAGSFDIYAVDLGGGTSVADGTTWKVARVTRTLGGAVSAEVSPKGRWLVYVAVSSHGFRVERIPFQPATWERAGPPGDRVRAPPVRNDAVNVDVGTATRPYSSLPSLWPRSWLPVVAFSSDPQLDWFIGASTFGSDDLRRHSYAAFAGWRTGPADLEGAAVYRYSGLGDPVLELSLSQGWDGRRVRVEDQTVPILERDREARLAARFVRPRVRSALSVTPAFEVEWLSYSTDRAGFQFADPDLVDLEGSLALGYSTARIYPRSISPEAGWLAFLDLSHRRLADDLGRWLLSAEARLRLYRSFTLFGFANHVLAARLAYGASDGHRRGAEVFELGGQPSQFFEVVAGLGFGAGSAYPIRGFDEGVQVGDRAATVNLEYRFPLALVGRGHGLWPVLLDRLSGSLFIDAGSAWSDSRRINVLAAAGAELSTHLGLGYYLRSRFRLGVARSLVDSPEDWRVYLATGLAF